jgi:hypothetical protein
MSIVVLPLSLALAADVPVVDEVVVVPEVVEVSLEVVVPSEVPAVVDEVLSLSLALPLPLLDDEPSLALALPAVVAVELVVADEVGDVSLAVAEPSLLSSPLQPRGAAARSSSEERTFGYRMAIRRPARGVKRNGGGRAPPS